MNKWLIPTSIFISSWILGGCASSQPVGNNPPAMLKMQPVNYAAQPAFRSDAPTRYVVKNGDTLWDIAGTFLHSPARWRTIWHSNPKIRNPNLIYSGDIISFTTVGGEKRLQVSGSNNPVRGEYYTGKKTADGRPIYDAQPTIRYEEIEQPIPAIPYHVIAPFISKNRVFSSTTVANDYPFIVGDGGNSYLSLSHKDKIYAKGEIDQFNSETYQIFREVGAVTDPVSKAYLGTMAIFIANTALLNAPNQDGVAELVPGTNSANPILPNDILIPTEADVQGEVLTFLPSLPELALSPIVIKPMENGLSGSQFQTLMVNMGSEDGVVDGNVFKIVRGSEKFAQGRDGKAYKLPDYDIGMGIVYKTYDNLSYVLVMESQDLIYKNDRLIMP